MYHRDGWYYNCTIVPVVTGGIAVIPIKMKLPSHSHFKPHFFFYVLLVDRRLRNRAIILATNRWKNFTRSAFVCFDCPVMNLRMARLYSRRCSGQYSSCFSHASQPGTYVGVSGNKYCFAFSWRLALVLASAHRCKYLASCRSLASGNVHWKCRFM